MYNMAEEIIRFPNNHKKRLKTEIPNIRFMFLQILIFVIYITICSSQHIKSNHVIFEANSIN